MLLSSNSIAETTFSCMSVPSRSCQRPSTLSAMTLLSLRIWPRTMRTQARVSDLNSTMVSFMMHFCPRYCFSYFAVHITPVFVDPAAIYQLHFKSPVSKSRWMAASFAFDDVPKFCAFVSAKSNDHINTPPGASP